jgi:sugar phosphate isomerase/epimerase
MKFAGFADEVSVDIDKQIEATKALGWTGIETRLVGKGLHFDDVDEKQFEEIKAKLDQAGVSIICYGSQIANWARPITSDFKMDEEELKRIIPRMHKTGTKFVRIMSYPNDGLEEGPYKTEVIKRIRELSRIAEDGGVILCHENCSGWAGEGPEKSLELINKVNSSALKLIFDTGNPISHGQDVYAFYQAVKPHIIHMHIKDYQKTNSTEKGTKPVFPGEGLGAVPEIVADLKKSGYDGWYTMEPHIVSAIHEGKDVDMTDKAREIFIKYGRMFEEIYKNA